MIEQIIEKNNQAASHYLDQLHTQFSLKGLEIKTDIATGDDSVAVLHDMVKRVDADLVMLVAHGGSAERRWPYGSAASSFIAYGDTPLLILQDLSHDEIPQTHAELAVREGKGH